MHIELVVPPYKKVYGIVRSVNPTDPPLGLAYIAAYLKKNGVSCGIIDSEAEQMTLDDVVTKIKSINPSIVGITTTTHTILDVYKLASNLKKINKNIVIVAGGPHATSLPSQTLKESEIDIVVRKEGEIPTLEIVRALENGVDLSAVEGVSYKSNGEIIENADASQIRDLDSLPFPSRELLPMKKYFPVGFPPSENTIYTSMLTTRGCAFRCTFCGVTTMFPKVRRRSPENILAEIDEVVQKYNVNVIEFMDSILGLYPNIIKEMCQGIIERKLNIKWMCCGRVDLMAPDLLQLMKEAGCVRIFYGIESGDQNILNHIQKRSSLDKIRETVKLTKEYKIPCVTSFILGLPGDTMETMKSTIDFAVELDADFATCSLSTPYPGTVFYDAAGYEGDNFSDWSKYQTARYRYPVYSPDGISPEVIQKMLKKFYRKFYLRPTYLFKRIASINSIDAFRYNFGFLKNLLS